MRTGFRFWKYASAMALTAAFGVAQADQPGTLAGHRAQLEAPRMYFAPKAGLVVPIDTGGDATFAWGGEAGFPVADHVTLAVSVIRDDANTLPMMLKGFMHAQPGSGFNYGLQAGVVNHPQTDDNDFGAGLVLGYDYRITPLISAGVSAEHVTAFGDDAYHLLHFMVPVKFHF